MHIDDSDVTRVPTHRRHVGLVFQDNQLFPHRSVVDNVAFGLQMERVDKRHPPPAGRASWLDRVGLGGFERAGRDRTVGRRSQTRRARPDDDHRPASSCCSTSRSPASIGRCTTAWPPICAPCSTAAGTTAVLVTHDRDEAAVDGGTVGRVARPVASGSGDRSARGRPPAGRHPRPAPAGAARVDALDRGDLRRRRPPDAPCTSASPRWIRQACVVAVSTWMRAPFADRPDAAAPSSSGAWPPNRRCRDTGLGARLLDAGVQRARADGADLVWATGPVDGAHLLPRPRLRRRRRRVHRRHDRTPPRRRRPRRSTESCRSPLVRAPMHDLEPHSEVPFGLPAAHDRCWALATSPHESEHERHDRHLLDTAPPGRDPAGARHRDRTHAGDHRSSNWPATTPGAAIDRCSATTSSSPTSPRLHSAADDLRAHAWQLERQAQGARVPAALPGAGARHPGRLTVRTAYDPARIRQLSTRTVIAAIDALCR